MRLAKNRWIAAVLNALIWGFGYLYLEEKRTFAKLLFLGWLVSHSAWLITRIINGQYFSPLTYQVIGGAGFLIIDFAFAYDAYQLAKELPSQGDGLPPRS